MLGTGLLVVAAVRFVTIDPGHFHAALVQKRAYDGVSPEVSVYAPSGDDLTAHLALIEAFNTRADSPTAWKENVCASAGYLAKFKADAAAKAFGECPVVILSGKNDLKGDYALAAVKAGCHVLADKPLAITPEVFAKTCRAARLAQSKGLCFADIMTERNEITTILQRALTQDRDLYGEQEKGTAEEPAIVKESVHHYCKLVNGKPLKRPAWFYDTSVQGDGIADVTTHLVDMVQWSAFPGVRLSTGDVEVVSAKMWPTHITQEQFKLSTGETVKSPMDVNANGSFTWRLRGVSCKVAVMWNFMPPKGGGDTHYSLMRGTRADVYIRQGKAEGYRPVLYVKSRGDATQTGKALTAAIERIARTWPGVTASPTDEAGVWRVSYPAKYDVGHEAHFGQVVEEFLGWLRSGREDPDYVDNMLVKYHTIVTARNLALAAGKQKTK